ncbi:SprT family zinc-dependent metalloprotease [Photobacterium swingsii]|uniref:Protein SprT n=1 Tax=Photobacterium swingsii TaxID=680026 RepID=A0A0J8XSV3_9GAMM|nr:SprT family zinc-dependent metalloprotease [Photobacterium swingsii]KMV28449.1 SprT protein [Photobacterium swingsii]PSW21662.1 SprT family zinc-dependent metalloprotease [Photobacterium swingsii]
MSSLQSQVIAKVESCISHANQRLQKRFAMPTVSFRQGGKIAGSARLQGWEVRFNPVLLKENPQAFLDEVVPHEVAHLITFKLFGRVRPHGKEWQTIMTQVFGIPARTTHSFDVSSVQGKTFSYQCQCSQHQLTVRRHNKVARGQVSYHCRQCRQPLTLCA